MGHTYTCLHYHIAFSTRGRANLIPKENLERVHAYLAGVARRIGGQVITTGGTANHVHLLGSLPANQSVSHAVNVIKSNSSRWVKDKLPTMAGFAWQEGYGAFAVSKSNLAAVGEYIDGQAEHHRTMSFEHEFLALLARHGIEYDPRYVVD